MTKMEYLRKTFAQASGKSFENYVITQIWAAVKDFGLRPITQQYVKRSKDKYALIDLYFPQIKFAIEIDEKNHDKIKELDGMRQEDIYRSVLGIKIEKIKEGEYEEVERQIKEVVQKIKTASKGLEKFDWLENWRREKEEKLLKIKNRKVLKVSDFAEFNEKVDVLKILEKKTARGLDYKVLQQAILNISENEAVFFPDTTLGNKFKNNLSGYWEQISGIRTDADPSKILYTFAKCDDSLGNIVYRFVGVFKFILPKKGRICIHKRISDKMEL